MAQANTKTAPRTKAVTHEGGPARGDRSVMDQLRRSVSSCLLWEATFYEDGVSIAERIADLTVQAVRTGRGEDVCELARHARSALNLRHVGLLLCRVLAKEKALDAHTLATCIQRPDELAEFLAIYFHDGRQPLSNQVKRGLAFAFQRFDAYQLAKWNKLDRLVKLRDVMRLSHPRPSDEEQCALWGRLVKGELKQKESGKWESRAAAGEDLKKVFTEQLIERKLGALALIRNLRKMEQLGIGRALIEGAMAEANVRRILPFRFITAAKAAPHMEPALEATMFRAVAEDGLRLPGETVILVDVSGSMTFGGDVRRPTGPFHPALGGIPQKRDIEGTMPFDAAAGLAMIAREMTDRCRVVAFGTTHEELPARRGFALRDACRKSSPWGGGTYLGQACEAVFRTLKGEGRVICLTDEQARDKVPNPPAGIRAYMINVQPYEFGVGYGPWVAVNGFSEYVLRWIHQTENPNVGVQDENAA